MPIVPAGEKPLTVRLIEEKSGRPFASTIRELREQGMTFRQIGRQFGVSGQAVWRNFKRETPVHAAS